MRAHHRASAAAGVMQLARRRPGSASRQKKCVIRLREHISSPVSNIREMQPSRAATGMYNSFPLGETVGQVDGGLVDPPAEKGHCPWIASSGGLGGTLKSGTHEGMGWGAG
jgi:hypothetical protein